MTEPAHDHDDQAPGDGGHDDRTGERLTRLEQAIGRIEDRLGQLGSHQAAEQRTERRLDRGTVISDEMRAELRAAAADLHREQREQAEGKAREDEHAAEHARLREEPPAAPARKATQLLGWGDGRK